MGIVASAPIDYPAYGMFGALGRLIRELARRERYDFAGGTAFAGDARDVYWRYRQGESLLDGPHIAEFERSLREYHDGHEVVTFAAGRMALYAILKAMSLPEGGEVILSGYTCVVIPNAIRRAGLRPVYVDISHRNFNMDMTLVAKAVTPNTCAILAQDTFGIPCDRTELLSIADRVGIPLIEDGAHAIGACWDGKRLGQFGAAAFFSTQATKMFSTERGGYALTGDKELARRIRRIQQDALFGSVDYERSCMLRWCYRAGLYGVPVLNPRLRVAQAVLGKLRIPFVSRILHYDAAEYQAALDGCELSPYPARLPNLMAYAGLLQVQRLGEDLAHRRQLAHYLETELPRLGARIATYDHQRAKPSWVRFPFTVEDRVVWAASMTDCGLPPGEWLNDPIHPKGCDWRAAGYTRGQCPNAETVAKHILNVPIHRRVSLHCLQKWIARCAKLQLG